jgi:tRNA threonylcarbamoyl adenosine modification protein YjeE
VTAPTAETIETRSVEETEAFAQRLGERLGAGDCVALIGELGAGKTVLARGIARGLHVGDGRIVSSPTYVLVHEYEGRVPVQHVDLYRLADPRAELAELGVEEMLAEGVVLIEWADRAAGALPVPRWQVSIAATGANSRRLELRYVD